MFVNTKEKDSLMGCLSQKNSNIGKSFDRFGEILYGLIRVPVLNAISDTVLNMALQHHLTGLMQGRFRCVDLRQNIFTGNILIDHPVDGLHLADDLL